MTLFALEVNKEGETQVHLNPAEYILEEELTYGYVIANQLPNITQFNDMEFPNVERSRIGAYKPSPSDRPLRTRKTRYITLWNRNI